MLLNCSRKNLPLEGNRPAGGQSGDHFFPQQVNPGVNQSGAGARAFLDKLGHAAIRIDCDAPISSHIRDRLQHDDGGRVAPGEQFEGRGQAPLDKAVAIEDQDRVAQHRLSELERSPGPERFALLGNS